MYQAFQTFRALVFYFFYVIVTFVHSITALPFIWFLPFKAKYSYICSWNKWVLWMGEHICGVRYRIKGLENIPKGSPFVALAKHSSQWETFYLLHLFKPVSTILKQELLKIPGFGWGLAMLKPIPIDRANPKRAIKQIRTEGLKRLLEDKLPVLIFPEGTRVPWGKKGKYARGGASLAIDANVPVIFISHNAGYFWPHPQMTKRPGVIDIIISKPVDPTGKTPKELTQEAQDWIEGHIIDPAQTAS